MLIKLELLQQQLFKTPALIAFASLFIGVVALSFSPILLRWSEYELSPNATIFNRFYLATVVFGLWLRTKFSPTTIQLWICGSAALVTFPILLFSGDKLFPSSIGGWLAIISFTLICQVCGHGLLTYSLDKLSSVVVSLVHLLQPVFSGIFAWAIFWETLSFSKWLGFSVVLIGLYLAVSSQAAVDSSLSSVEDG